jgi:superfamily I DNA and/or RNA helicase
VKNSYPLSNGFFDIVIIDEASQCDVASALPLIYRAKQLVVIGDPLQLKHISAVNADEEMAIKNYLDFAENPFVKYADYSLWDYCKDLVTIAKENSRPVVLDCHYRCHPQIIGYSNRMFYERIIGTTLNVKTIEKNPMLRQKGIIWEDVRGVQRSERLNINDAEVGRCISIASDLATQYPNISIGIISPFRHQAQELNAHIPDKLTNRIVADTVNRFQGDERDVIIYSLVVTSNSPNSKIRWIDYSVPNLVNVAVTRARTALYIVGNRNYIKSHSRLDLPLGNLVDYCETHASV